MKQIFGIGLGLLGGMSIGALGVSVLHAQAKPPVFQITLQDVSNQEGLNKEFVPLARPTVKAYGGIPIASGVPTAIEGSTPSNRMSSISGRASTR
jgi:hypothetical protein